MIRRPSFSEEIANLMYASGARRLDACIQCATCSSTCPAVEFMDHSPRAPFHMIAAGLRDEVLRSNTFWTCASCYACTDRCPKDLHPATIMYALKRYSVWKGRYRKDLVGPEFSRRFVRTILKTGKSYEPGYAPAFIFEGGIPGLLREVRTGVRLLRKGRLPLRPSRIRRVERFRRMLSRVIPLERIA